MTTTPSRKLVVFSGGSAANSLVDVFNELIDKNNCTLSYIIPISDNGGSSSELIRVFGGPGIGDIRSISPFLSFRSFLSRTSRRSGVCVHKISSLYFLSQFAQIQGLYLFAGRPLAFQFVPLILTLHQAVLSASSLLLMPQSSISSTIVYPHHQSMHQQSFSHYSTSLLPYIIRFLRRKLSSSAPYSPTYISKF